MPGFVIQGVWLTLREDHITTLKQLSKVVFIVCNSNLSIRVTLFEPSQYMIKIYRNLCLW